MTTGTVAQTTILLTGFVPFDGQATNPSWAAVQEVLRTWAGSDEDIHVLLLPVDFDSFDRALTDALESFRPDVVICVGQAGGASALRLERVAINIDDARIPDNQGWQPVDEPIVPEGPAAYFSTLPIKAVAELGRLGIPAVVSQTAGTYACNHVFYRLMHEIGRSGRDVRGGFVHVPFAPEQAVSKDFPSMAVDAMARGVAAVLATTLWRSADARIVGGSLH